MDEFIKLLDPAYELIQYRIKEDNSIMSLRPLTCHIPVIPGLIAIRAL